MAKKKNRVLSFTLAALLSLATFPLRCAPVTTSWNGKTYNGAFQTPWQSETEYIVKTVAWDLAEMAYYQKTGRLLEPGNTGIPLEAIEQTGRARGDMTFNVIVHVGKDTVKCDIPIKAGLWSPTTYAPLTAALFKCFALAARSGRRARSLWFARIANRAKAGNTHPSRPSRERRVAVRIRCTTAARGGRLPVRSFCDARK